MKKELIGIILVTTLVAIVFAGCTGDNGEEDDESPSVSYVRDNAVWPSVDGDKLVYAGNSDGCVYLYNLSLGKETMISSSEYDKEYTRIKGDHVIWEEYVDGNHNIYCYNISTQETFKVCNNKYPQEYPLFCGDYIIWRDYRDAFSDGSIVCGSYDDVEIRGYNLITNEEEVLVKNGGYNKVKTCGDYGFIYLCDLNKNFNQYHNYYYFDMESRSSLPYDEIVNKVGISSFYEGSSEILNKVSNNLYFTKQADKMNSSISNLNSDTESVIIQYDTLKDKETILYESDIESDSFKMDETCFYIRNGISDPWTQRFYQINRVTYERKLIYKLTQKDPDGNQLFDHGWIRHWIATEKYFIYVGSSELNPDGARNLVIIEH